MLFYYVCDIISSRHHFSAHSSGNATFFRDFIKPCCTTHWKHTFILHLKVVCFYAPHVLHLFEHHEAPQHVSYYRCCQVHFHCKRSLWNNTSTQSSGHGEKKTKLLYQLQCDGPPLQPRETWLLLFPIKSLELISNWTWAESLSTSSVTGTKVFIIVPCV